MSSILIIDDETQTRTMIRQMLEDNGYQVLEAENGKQGLLLFNQTPTDLIITDIIMPEQDGIETIMCVRRNYPNVNIIAISGGGRYSNTDYLNMAQKLGAAAVLHKPFKREVLLEQVKELLDDENTD